MCAFFRLGNALDRNGDDTGDLSFLSCKMDFICWSGCHDLRFYYVSCACMYPEKEAISLEEAPQDLDIWYKEGDTPSGGQ